MKKTLLVPILAILTLLLTVQVFAQSVPYGVADKIRAKAERDWPNDYRMQKHTIETQTEAYIKLENLTSIQGVPDNILTNIKEKAESDWGDDYRMRVHTIESQANAYRELNH
jgi:hypothetical protein